MDSYNLLINGRMVAGDQTMPVINPATEEVLVQCPRASQKQLDEAVAAAKAAFPAWSATTMDERRKLIVKMAEAIEKNAGDLARILTQEQGKPLADATAETMGMAGFFRYFASLDLPPFRLTPFRIKMRVLQALGQDRDMGLDFVCCLAFDQHLAGMTAPAVALTP